jgi:hypothetical protein
MVQIFFLVRILFLFSFRCFFFALFPLLPSLHFSSFFLSSSSFSLSSSIMASLEGNKDCRFIIREVWGGNLHEEMAVIRDIIEKYPFVAMASA